MSDDPFDDSPLDLSSLARDLVTPVMRRIDALPRVHPHTIGPLWGLWSMSRGLAMAGATAVCVLLAWTQPWHVAPSQRLRTVAESIGVPPEFLELLARDGGRR